MKVILAAFAVAVIYLLIKQKNNKSTRPSSEPLQGINLRFELARSMIDYLNLQLLPLRDQNGEAPSTAYDNFSIGYICGATDAALQYKRITTVSQEELLTIIIPQLFGREQASEITERLAALIEENNTDYLKGCHTGGNEFFDAANGKIRNSLSWFHHLNSAECQRGEIL